MRRLPAVVALTALSLWACDDATAPETPAEGVSFTWDGGAAQRSSGPPSIGDGKVLSGEFAVAFPDSVGGLVLASFHPLEGRRGDLFILQLVETQTGQLGPCAPSGGCHGRLLEGVDPEDPTNAPRYWEITSGALQIDAPREGRVRGSFGNLTLTGPDGGETVRRIAQGTFDVPLLTDAQGAGVMRCLLRALSGGECG